jgi:tetratricopeptide (TPR) repeat protein
MFIIIPLVLIGISVIGISIIIWKKVPYLKKLDIESITSNGSGFTWQEFFNDMLPEVSGKQHKIKEFKDLWLSELEKFVRRMRLLSLKIDNLSGRLIGKIRRVNRQKPLTSNGNVETEEAVQDKVGPIESADPNEFLASMSALKQKEQALIIKVAKDPKNAGLYDELADLYVSMKQWRDAEESLKAALDLNPENESLKKKLSSVLEKLKS